jgi:hypothetical protein
LNDQGKIAMNFRHATLIAVPVLGAVTYLTYLQLQPAEVTPHHSNAVSVDHIPTVTTIQGGQATNLADLAALRAEVDALRAEVLALRHQLPAQSSPVASRADGPPAADVRSDQSAQEEEAATRQAQMEKIDAAFRRQTIDQSWSANTTSAIHAALNSTEAGGLQAENIDCRSSSCRVELHDDGTGRLGKSLPIFALQLAGSMPTVTADTIPQNDGTSNVVLYMSRDSADAQPSE